MDVYDVARVLIMSLPTLIVAVGGVVLWRGGRMGYTARHVAPYATARHRAVGR